MSSSSASAASQPPKPGVFSRFQRRVLCWGTRGEVKAGRHFVIYGGTDDERKDILQRILRKTDWLCAIPDGIYPGPIAGYQTYDPVSMPLKPLVIAEAHCLTPEQLEPLLARYQDLDKCPGILLTASNPETLIDAFTTAIPNLGVFSRVDLSPGYEEPGDD